MLLKSGCAVIAACCSVSSLLYLVSLLTFLWIQGHDFIGSIQADLGEDGEQVGGFMTLMAPFLIAGMSDLGESRANLPPALAAIFDDAAGKALLDEADNSGWRHLIWPAKFIGERV